MTQRLLFRAWRSLAFLRNPPHWSGSQSGFRWRWVQRAYNRTLEEQ